ncbi:MAG TPA: type II secretion system F family protein [Candidatus Omnitrophica bacterium]|nr:type II secretion system F family protein [Candidatus Omnitrophota bacterium]
MPTFVYKAKDSEGKSVRDKIIAESYQDALFKLRENFPVIVSLKEEKEGGFFKKKEKIKLELLAQFSRELATMVGTGIPLVRGLVILSKQFKEKKLADIALQLSASIEGGNSFAESLARFPSIFSPLYINMVSAGEASGMLNKILERLATYLERSALLLRKVRGAMVYPLVIVIVALIITSVLFLKVIPGFQAIFESLGGELPLPTQIIIGISNIVRRFFLLFIVSFFVLGILFFRYINTPSGKLKFDRLKLKIPVLGDLFQKVIIARFSSTLSTLLEGGLPILEGLTIISRAIGNRAVEKEIMEVREEVRRGKRLSEELRKKKYFPPMVVEMIGVGEESGELSEMLDKVAESYEEQVDIAISALVGIIEPFIIVFLGIVVGGIAISMFLPIFRISQLIH